MTLLIIIQKEKRGGEESPGKEEKGQSQEAHPEGKGQTPAKETEGQCQSGGPSGAQLFGGLGGEEGPAGPEGAGGPPPAAGAPEENRSKALVPLFFVHGFG